MYESETVHVFVTPVCWFLQCLLIRRLINSQYPIVSKCKPNRQKYAQQTVCKIRACTQRQLFFNSDAITVDDDIVYVSDVQIRIHVILIIPGSSHLIPNKMQGFQ